MYLAFSVPMRKFINCNSEILAIFDLILIVNSKREIELKFFNFGGVVFKLGLYCYKISF